MWRISSDIPPLILGSVTASIAADRLELSKMIVSDSETLIRFIPRISPVDPNPMSLSPALTIAVTFVRPVHLILREVSESGRREKGTMDIVEQRTNLQESRL
jgi:hypothetical protein